MHILLQEIILKMSDCIKYMKRKTERFKLFFIIKFTFSAIKNSKFNYHYLYPKVFALTNL